MVSPVSDRVDSKPLSSSLKGIEWRCASAKMHIKCNHQSIAGSWHWAPQRSWCSNSSWSPPTLPGFLPLCHRRARRDNRGTSRCRSRTSSLPAAGRPWTIRKNTCQTCATEYHFLWWNNETVEFFRQQPVDTQAAKDFAHCVEISFSLLSITSRWRGRDLVKDDSNMIKTCKINQEYGETLKEMGKMISKQIRVACMFPRSWAPSQLLVCSLTNVRDLICEFLEIRWSHMSSHPFTWPYINPNSIPHHSTPARRSYG